MSRPNRASPVPLSGNPANRPAAALGDSAEREIFDMAVPSVLASPSDAPDPPSTAKKQKSKGAESQGRERRPKHSEEDFSKLKQQAANDAQIPACETATG